MKWDSIKSRLLLMTALCVFGMTLMTANQHFASKKLVQLSEHNSALQQLQNDLLQLRRHEKDFLIRKDDLYVAKFRDQKSELQIALSSLNQIVAQYELSQQLVFNITQNAQQYANKFTQLVALYTELGVTKGRGITGELSAVTQQLTEQLTTMDARDAALISQLNYLVLNYQLAPTPDLVEEFTHRSTLVLSRLSKSTELGILIARYSTLFYQYVDIKQRVGLSENLGLRGEFRLQAHAVEDDLALLSEALQPLLDEQREKATWYSTAIAFITSVVLVLLLVKSFATFHRAFANFVLFFYRCKRQYQRIDTRQLGFSEFRSLAGLANEMVESRRQVEQRLAKLEASVKANKNNS